jgi:uncharacterized membrane protein
MSFPKKLNPFEYRWSEVLNFIWRLFQVIVGLATIGFYATDIKNANAADKYTDGKWVRTLTKDGSLVSIPPEFVRALTVLSVLAVTTGALSTVIAVVEIWASAFVQYSVVALLFVSDWIIVILYAVVTGIFGSMYMEEKVEMEAGIQRMKTAAWFDLVGLILWLCSAIMTTWFFLSADKGRFFAKRGKEYN